MTYKTKIRKLKNLKKLYVDYLKESEHNEADEKKLVNEIARLNNQIELLEAKPIAFLNKIFDSWDLKKESVMNKETVYY